MSNEQQYIIIVRFPEWEQEPIAEAGQEGPQKYAAFGMKFLFTMPIIPFPEWPEEDERWFTYSEEAIVKRTFREAFNASRSKPFDGEILFVEPTSMSVLKAEEVSV